MTNNSTFDIDQQIINDDEYDDIDTNTVIEDLKSQTTTVVTTPFDLKKKINNDKFHHLVTNTSFIPYTSYSYKDILMKILHNDFTGIDLINMLPKDSVSEDNYAFKSIENCHYSLKLGKIFKKLFKKIHFFVTSVDIYEINLFLSRPIRELLNSGIQSVCWWHSSQTMHRKRLKF